MPLRLGLLNITFPPQSPDPSTWVTLGKCHSTSGSLSVLCQRREGVSSSLRSDEKRLRCCAHGKGIPLARNY